MSVLPRLALGSIQSGSDLTSVLWALGSLLNSEGITAQTFLSRAYFTAADASQLANGSTFRHLDSWVMSRAVCRRAFRRAASACDLAIVHGNLGSADHEPGSKLSTLCDWLDLPAVGVVDLDRLGRCRLPKRPGRVDALMLDGLAQPSDYMAVRTNLEALWGIPVIGAVIKSDAVRNQIAGISPGAQPSDDLIRELATGLATTLDLRALVRIAESRQYPEPTSFPVASTGRASNLKIAVAYDDAFNCYFPDTLDGLEQQGASLRVFSPLRDERLPADTDIVYFGCGHPERFADELAQNHCMMMDIRQHVCSGRRIYAEGGGLAYLCRFIESADGIRTPMVGALPAIARRNPSPEPVRPVELGLSRDCWLGAATSTLRGYLNSAWELQPTGPLVSYCSELENNSSLVGRHRVIGSRVHLNFAALPGLIDRFFLPCPAAPDLVTPPSQA